MDEKKVHWYEKKEYYALVALIAGGVKQFTAPHTVAHQASDYMITVGLPLAMGFFGIKDGIKNNSLPGGLSKLIKK